MAPLNNQIPLYKDSKRKIRSIRGLFGCINMSTVKDTTESPDTKNLENKPATSLEASPIWFYVSLAIIVLFSLRYLFIFSIITTFFTVSFFALLIFGSYFVTIPRNSSSSTRAKFPRLNFTKPESWNEEIKQLQLNQDFAIQENSGPFTKEVDELIGFILRDFVSSWFQIISEDKSFPNQIKLHLKLVFSELEARIYQVDMSQLLILELLPLITNHFSNFVTAEDIVIGEQRNLISITDMEVRTAKEFVQLHSAISLKDLEKDKEVKKYSRAKVSEIIPYLLAKNEQSSSAALILVRELLTSTVFQPVIQLLSDPDFWNQTIVKMASATLKDRVQVREIRSAIDRQYNNPTKPMIPTITKNPLLERRLTPTMRQPEFEKYLKSIEKSDSVQILKQLKYYLAIQISRTQKINSSSAKFLKFRRRLNLANSLIDQKLKLLSPDPDESNRKSVILNQGLDRFITGLTLLQVIGNPSSLSFFMEFMEQRSRTVLLQYWLTVNGIKDPLENPKDPDYEEELSSSVDLTGAEDIKQIFRRFFDNRNLKVNKETYNEVKNFVDGNSRSLSQYIQVRKLTLMLQEEVFHRMEERDLPDFKKSDLFLKLLSSEAFEESLVNEVDFVHESSFEQFQDREEDEAEEDTGSPEPPNRTPSNDLESVLTEIMAGKDAEVNTPKPPLIKSASSDFPNRLSLSDDLRNEIFGSSERGFLTEKPLFDDGDDDEIREDESILSDSKFEVDPDFFSISHDVLNLKEEITALEHDVEKLNEQNAMLDPLILKAELTNNTNELRILKKSKASYEREIESKELQKQQLIVQDNDNSLFGKTSIKIDSWVKGRSHGKDYILYVIEVQKSSEGKNGTGWITGRRFSQFHRLNELLRKKYPAVEQLPFPKKKIILKFQQKALIDERRLQLESYLKKLLEIEDVCSDKEFRKFLTTQDYKVSSSISEVPTPVPTARSRIEDTASKIYSGLSSSIDLLNSRSVSTDNLALMSEESQLLHSQNVENVEDMQKELENFDAENGRSESPKSFIKPVTDLVIALFSLNKPNSWLRGRAIIVVLQQIFGSTIEKHIKDLISGLTTQDRVIDTVRMLKNILWPNGKFMERSAPRTNKEKSKSKQEARVLLETLMIDVCSKIVGQPTAKNASNKVASMLQNDILNRSLVYGIFDKLLDSLFPELNK